MLLSVTDSNDRSPAMAAAWEKKKAVVDLLYPLTPDDKRRAVSRGHWYCARDVGQRGACDMVDAAGAARRPAASRQHWLRLTRAPRAPTTCARHTTRERATQTRVLP